MDIGIAIDWTWAIDGLGIVLAIIGFFNLGPKIQAGMDVLIKEARDYELYMLRELNCLFPLRKHWRTLIAESVADWFGYFLMFPVWLVIAGKVDEFWLFLTSTHWAILALIPFAVVLICIALWLLIHQFAGAFLIAMAHIVWTISYVLNAPPAGALGVLGLGITVASVYLNRL